MTRSTLSSLHTSAAVIALGFGVIAAGGASAQAFYVPQQSVVAAGRANSGEAAAQGASALWWNPAGIARSGREIYVGGHGRFVSLDANDSGSTITRPIPPTGLTTAVGGDSTARPTQDDFIPNGAIVIPVTDAMTFGFSVTSPYRLDNDYGTGSWARYDTIHSKIETTDYQATLALQAAEWLDLGASVSLQTIDAALRSASPNLSPLQPDAEQLLVGDGQDWGWSVGAQAYLGALTLGGSYRSAMDRELDGRLSLSGLQAPLDGANFAAPSQTRFTTPWMASFAARWQATAQLALNGQIERQGWSEYDAIRIAFAGMNAAIDQNYKDITTVAVGMDYQATPAWALRTGVRFDPTPTRDDPRETGVPDTDRVTFAVGTSYEIQPGVTLDAALSYVDFDTTDLFERAVFYDGTPARITADIRGEASGSATTASIGLRWRF